ncbi:MULTISPECIES: nitrilase-related carbon-nitrogen hydrolase [unclassified Paenibacillus]|uniref:nitrilase-related carbon-nitrogen hydrolase n=1 Tax=unclassified Paenibacillus TaxID=185978 RepID=UPI002404C17D|nr:MULTISPECIES: nitrilase-related carbon-nitrogen hydrolase [unclassified Paenibacillus]MDF9844765.1 putative amidohydrolase [Paenibacillus sp. PastF-2]MDF9851367.1 putative amidohydrolase [Paenibacillus sp. PastM-2]MDF9857949.1 putative amidohydrolase [Paenibacillus sp. PastF-1]MDH6483217.1 putative amidohydrolase [Paenibacillus sp. PastH-2]MDH6510627.1 putative amidohydrolase [Paenibacillus sp. PastM-3]
MSRPDTVSFMNDQLVNTTPIKVAAVNAESAANYNLQAGLKKADKIIKEAKEAGAILVAFPELWLPGFMNGGNKRKTKGVPPERFQDYIDHSIEEGSAEWTSVLELAKDNEIYLSMSISEKNTTNAALYMTQLLISPDGKVLDKRSKINPSGGERSYFADMPIAENLNVVNTPLGRIGQLSCGEHLKPLMTYPMMAQAENIHVVAFPYNILGDEAEWWETYNLNKTVASYYALASGSWTILTSVGTSAIINGVGEVIAEADNQNSNFAIAEIERTTFNNMDKRTNNFSSQVLELIEETYLAKSPNSK